MNIENSQNKQIAGQAAFFSGVTTTAVFIGKAARSSSLLRTAFLTSNAVATISFAVAASMVCDRPDTNDLRSFFKNMGDVLESAKEEVSALFPAKEKSTSRFVQFLNSIGSAEYDAFTSYSPFLSDRS